MPIFQIDSDIVNQTYQDNNYQIEFNNNCPFQEYCAIYFSSNDIYYPNNEQTFRQRIIIQNSYEWYKTRIVKAYKHIFLRDIYKQWYLKGINSQINSPQKSIEWLKNETNGYKIITIGSSAGGYAAILYGSMLNAHKVIAFNPQFEIRTILNEPEGILKNPIVNATLNTADAIYLNISNLISNKIKIFYFYSSNSPWDYQQSLLAKKHTNIFSIQFKSSHHGIPFLKGALQKVINYPEEYLYQLSLKTHYPIIFTIKTIGIFSTLQALNTQLKKYIKRKFPIKIK